MSKAGTARTQTGVTLIELMVSIVIGLIVVLAASSVYVGNKQTYRTSEALSRLQDEARFATMTLRNAIQQAGYFGRLKNSITINGRLGSGSDILPGDLPSDDCYPGWSINLDRAVEALDTTSGNPYSSTCLDGSNVQHEPASNTDILVVRRAASAQALAGSDEDPLSPDNFGRIYLRTDVRRGELYVADSGISPAGYNATVEDRYLLSELYYITPNEFDSNDGIPVLRRKFLSEQAGSAMLRTERIARYVENFQVQVGEDTNGDGGADRFVEPAGAVPERAVSVRVWLLFRSETREQDYTAPASFTLADYTYDIPDGSEHFRRLLISRTYTLRNF